jgi:hypothetical protein
VAGNVLSLAVCILGATLDSVPRRMRAGFNLNQANGSVLVRNTANRDTQYGSVVFGGSSDDTLVRNAGLGDRKTYAWEEGTGTGDVWARNRLRTTVRQAVPAADRRPTAGPRAPAAT